MSERTLFVVIEEHSYTGSDNDQGDGSQYSGYSHDVIEIDHLGPAYFATEGKGLGSHRIDKGSFYRYTWDKNCNSVNPSPAFLTEESDIPENTRSLFFVIVRYGDGGTFGHTDGYYEFPCVALTRENAETWARENKERCRAAHSGYFESFEGVSIAEVEFVPEKMVQERRNLDDVFPTGYGNKHH